MHLFQKTTALVLLIGFFHAPSFSLASAAQTTKPGSSAPAPVTAQQNPVATPDPSTNPVLVTIINSGAKLYYMGKQAGLDGWFILKDGQMQLAYATPDGQHALIGGLFGPNGQNVTEEQVKALFEANPEIKAALTSSLRQRVEAQKAELIAKSQASDSPGEKLYLALSAAKGVTVGTNASAPLLMMVMDPNCPHCQATWRGLRDAVFKNTLQIRLIPIGTENSDSERAAAQLLHVADPLNAWNKYVDGDKTQLAGTPDKDLIAATQANHILVDNWNLKSTPILVYRGKDGKIKIEQGEPKDVTAILGDMISSTTAPISPTQ